MRNWSPELYNSCSSYMASFQESRIPYVLQIVSASQILHPRGSQGLSIVLKKHYKRQEVHGLVLILRTIQGQVVRKNSFGIREESWVLVFRPLTWHLSWFWSFERWLYYNSSVDRGPITFKEIFPIKTQNENYRRLWLVNWEKRRSQRHPTPPFRPIFLSLS